MTYSLTASVALARARHFVEVSRRECRLSSCSRTVAHSSRDHMDNLVFYIGLGIGLAIAAGLRPFLPLLLAGALGSAGVLGLGFVHGRYHFLQSGWWLVAVTVVLVCAYLAQITLGGRLESSVFAAVIAGLGVAAGALLFAGTLADHGKASWPGLVAGGLLAGLADRIVAPVIKRTRQRLEDRTAREALTVYLDGVALLIAALVALLHPLGYVALALFLWFAVAGRRRSREKYAGLRILRRQ